MTLPRIFIKVWEKAQTFFCSYLTLLGRCFVLQLLLFGGHGTGGWLSRYDIYYNDTIILDRCELSVFSCCTLNKYIYKDMPL